MVGRAQLGGRRARGGGAAVPVVGRLLGAVPSNCWATAARLPGDCQATAGDWPPAPGTRSPRNRASVPLACLHPPPAVLASACPPAVRPSSHPTGFSKYFAPNTPIAVMMMAPGYWNSAPDSKPPARQTCRHAASRGARTARSCRRHALLPALLALLLPRAPWEPAHPPGCACARPRAAPPSPVSACCHAPRMPFFTIPTANDTCVEVGPGMHWLSANSSANTASLSQCIRSTKRCEQVTEREEGG